MPASQTITAFYSFSPNTTIYSAQVNNNFDLMRGHWLPIDGSTTAFSNNAYDLGSSVASWRNTYSTNLYLGASGTINLLTASTTSFTLPNRSGTLALSTTPTIQIFDSASSGTYTTPTNCKCIIVKMVGAGGGGGANGSGPSNGTSGGNTVFGSATAGGGAYAPSGGGSPGGAGGTNTTAYTNILNIAGQAGSPGGYAIDEPGSLGGSSILGGGGVGGARGAGGTTPGGTPSGFGGGGGGGGGNGTYASGAGGGAGAYQEFLITSPSATYSYTVGAAGTLGGAGGGGNNGGPGFKGAIIVIEYY